MDVITVKGVEYQRASALAKKFKYTADYIGQLCRAKKVDAQLVGRSWYVNPESLKTHKKSRYEGKSSTDEKTINNKVEINKSRINVQPVLKKNTVKTISSTQKNFAKRIDWKPVKYEYDESDLLPKLTEPRKIKIELADSLEIPVTKTTKNTKLEAEPLPTVSLTGTLKVSSLEEIFETDEENSGNIEEYLENKANNKDEGEIVKEKEELAQELKVRLKSSKKIAKTAKAEVEAESFSVKIREEKKAVLKTEQKPRVETSPKVDKLDRKVLVPLRVQELEVVARKQRLQKILSSFVILFLSILLFLVLFLEIEVSSGATSSVTNFKLNFAFLADFID